MLSAAFKQTSKNILCDVHPNIFGMDVFPLWTQHIPCYISSIVVQSSSFLIDSERITFTSIWHTNNLNSLLEIFYLLEHFPDVESCRGKEEGVFTLASAEVDFCVDKVVDVYWQIFFKFLITTLH
jgi:hypothetical protein